MQGYIKVYRKLMESPVWGDSNYLKLWMYCLMKATHKEREIIVGNSIITLEPGQFITGRESLAEDLNKKVKTKQRLSEKTWYRYIENLDKWQMLTIKKTNKFSIVTINNWSEYQDSDHQMSIKCPSDDHQMSTNKNVKNVKNDKEVKDYTEKIKELFPVFLSIDDFANLNKKYWDVIRETRKTGKVAQSVIYNNMKKWQKYDLTVVEYALKEHISNHAGKKEEYTVGIMRNTSKDEALERMNNKLKTRQSNNVVPIGKRETKYDNYDYGF